MNISCMQNKSWPIYTRNVYCVNTQKTHLENAENETISFVQECRTTQIYAISQNEKQCFSINNALISTNEFMAPTKLAKQIDCYISAGFWVVSSKHITASLIKKCVVYRKHRGQPGWSHMADFPEDRCLPFSYVEIDTFGPWPVVDQRTRGWMCKSGNVGLYKLSVL